nr:reverse transcriptase domain-containing protein [Tanacetum cinerariifolium]
MAEDDEEKAAFITSQGIFRYLKMSFRLKNARATYRRLMDKAFQKQIGWTLEVYVDDLVIKRRIEQEVIRDMEETFKTLREINMKLNPKKYAFGDERRHVPGDVQRLNGKLANLNRFMSKSAEKSLPFFKTLKKCTKKSDFQWTTEAEIAFKQMKKSITELPTLTAPKEKDELIIYLAAAKEAISSTNDGRGRETNARLLDFIMEHPEDDSSDTPIEDKEELSDLWILFTDGSSCTNSLRAGLILTYPEGMEFTYALRFRFEATNNEAEYEALIAGLRIAEQMGAKNLQAHVDSRIVANQVNESYVAKEPGMIQYLEKVRSLTSTFKEFSIKQVPRGENKKADALSKIASTSFAHLRKQVLVEELKEKLIDEKEVLAVVEEEGRTWMTPIYEYLAEGILPDEKKKERVVPRKA